MPAVVVGVRVPDVTAVDPAATFVAMVAPPAVLVTVAAAGGVVEATGVPDVEALFAVEMGLALLVAEATTGC